MCLLNAIVAQLAEQLICNQQVGGSNPLGGSREVSSVGRASRLHREGHRFEPCTSHHFRGIAQSGSASALGAEGRWFESSYPDHGALAELVDALALGASVLRRPGSSPGGPTTYKHGEMAERSKALVLKTSVGQPTVGSNPTLSAT